MSYSQYLFSLIKRELNGLAFPSQYLDIFHDDTIGCQTLTFHFRSINDCNVISFDRQIRNLVSIANFNASKLACYKKKNQSVTFQLYKKNHFKKYKKLNQSNTNRGIVGILWELVELLRIEYFTYKTYIEIWLLPVTSQTSIYCFFKVKKGKEENYRGSIFLYFKIILHDSFFLTGSHLILEAQYRTLSYGLLKNYPFV